MNCFNNNRPKLSSSDRIKNKKAQAIFKANVMDYQTRSTGGNGKCSNYKGNVGFYNNGKLRKVENFETLMNINKGSALCVDGAYRADCLNLENEKGVQIKKGLNACGKNNDVKITLGRDNVYTVFSGYNKDISGISSFFSGFPVLKTYKIDESSFQPSKDNKILEGFFSSTTPEEYISVVDPSNHLFGSNFCSTDMNNKSQGPNKYLQYSSVNKYIIAEGPIFNVNNNNTPLDCGPDVLNIHNLVGFGTNFTEATPNINDSNTKGVGYVFKKCCGKGPNGENNWWTIYIRPLILVGSNPDITALGFFTDISSVNISIGKVMGLVNGEKKSFIAIYGAGDPCNRNLQSGNNSQQNYLSTYSVTSNKTRFNINPQIYNVTNVKEFSKISSSSSSSATSSSSIISTLTDFTDLFMFEGSGQALFQTNKLFNNIINARNFSTSVSNQYAALYNSGFDRVRDINTNNGDEDASNSIYKSVILKLNKSNNTFTFRGTPYQITSNTIPIKTILTESNLFSSTGTVIDNLFTDTNQNYLAFVYSQGRIGGSSSDLFGNLKVTGQLTTTTQSNWLNHSGKSTISSHSDTLNKNYGSLQDTNNYNLLIGDNIISDIYIILLFKNLP
jgi:hypothetical protein